MPSFSFVMIALGVVALGIVLLLLGIVLLVKRIRIEGAIIAFLGLGAIAVPILSILYVAIAMR